MGPTLNLNTSKSGGGGGFRSSLKSSTRRITNSISPVKQDELYALAERTLPAFSTDRSSTSSISSRRLQHKSRAASSSSASIPYLSDDNNISSHSPSVSRHQPSSSTASPIQKAQPFDGAPATLSRSFTASAPFSHANLRFSMASGTTMTTASFANESRPSTSKPSTSQSNISFGQGGNSTLLPPSTLPPALSGSVQSPHAVYQHIQDMSSKRISTLDYLRKA